MTPKPCEPEHAAGKTYRCGLTAAQKDVADASSATLVCPRCLGRILVLTEEHGDATAMRSLTDTVVEGLSRELRW